MPEIYLIGAIQKEGGRLTEGSVRFLQRGCGIADFRLPTGRQRLSTVESVRLKVGTEKNGGLVEEVANGKYHWAIAGEDMVEDLPDNLRDNVVKVRELGFEYCEYRLGIWEGISERLLVAEGRDRVEVLDDLKKDTKIATKHVNYLRRIIRNRGLNLEVVPNHTPETAPELQRIYVVADNYETGGTWANLEPFAISAKYTSYNEEEAKYEERDREIFLKSQAVLIRARRLPWGRARMFNEILLPRVDQALEHPERWLNPDSLENSQIIPPANARGANNIMDRVWEKVRSSIHSRPAGQETPIAIAS